MSHSKVKESIKALKLAKATASRAQSLANKIDRLDAILAQLNRRENYLNEVKKVHDATLLELEKF